MAANDNTQSNNQNEPSTEGRCITKRHLGRDLDTISRGLRDKIPVNISEGKLRPEEPLQAAKLASESGIPVFTHWKHYKEDAAKPLVKNYNDKLSKQLEDQKEAVRKNEEAARKNEEETEKLKQQGLEIQGLLRTLFGNKLASPDAQQ